MYVAASSYTPERKLEPKPWNAGGGYMLSLFSQIKYPALNWCNHNWHFNNNPDRVPFTRWIIYSYLIPWVIKLYFKYHRCQRKRKLPLKINLYQEKEKKKNHTNFPQKKLSYFKLSAGMTRYLSIYNAIFCFPYIDLGTSFVEFWIHNQTWHIHTKKLHMVTHPTSFGKGKDNGLIKRERRRKS